MKRGVSANANAHDSTGTSCNTSRRTRGADTSSHFGGAALGVEVTLEAAS